MNISAIPHTATVTPIIVLGVTFSFNINAVMGRINRGVVEFSTVATDASMYFSAKRKR